VIAGADVEEMETEREEEEEDGKGEDRGEVGNEAERRTGVGEGWFPLLLLLLLLLLVVFRDCRICPS